jgi:hypothetical protein
MTKRRRISDEAAAAVTEEDFWSLFITVRLPDTVLPVVYNAVLGF